MAERTNQFAVTLFGSPQITYRGESLKIPRTQIRALLYILAASPEAIPRAELCYLLWPDSPDAVTHRYLTNAMSQLRRALQEPTVLQRRGDAILLNPDLVWSDVRAFQMLADAAQTDPAAQAEVLQLYRDPFLKGVTGPKSAEFENWVLSERMRYERLYLSVLESHLLRASADGRVAEAIAGAESYLKVDPLSEPVYRVLIQEYGRAGDRAAVQQTYRRCQEVLAAELGVEPLPATLQVYERAFTHVDILQATSPAAPGRQPDILPPMPLVGRADALATLHRAWEHSRHGSGQCVLIGGEPGIGKSRLIREFLQAMGAGVNVLSGYCVPTGRFPYQALLEAIQNACETGLLPTTVDRRQLADIATLMPQLNAWFDPLPTPQYAEPMHRQARLFQALESVVESYAQQEKSVILVLEDLQWADSALLDWLSYLGPKLGKHRLLLLCTNTTGYESPQVQKLQTSLERSRVLHECRLKGLSGEEVYQLVQAIPRASHVDRSVVERLYRLSGGNPLYLSEIVRSLLAQDESLIPESLAEQRWWTESLHRIVERRVDQVGALERQMLQAAAICGESFDFQLVMHVAGRSEEEVLQVLDSLVQRQLISERPADYHFQHGVIRTVVDHSMSAGRRRLLHRRAAEFLEERHTYQTRIPSHPPAEPPAGATLSLLASSARIAYHFREATAYDRACIYLLSAGKKAFQALAFDEAIHHAREGLELLQDVPPSPARDRLEIELLTLVGNGTASAYGTANPEAADAFHRARRLIRHVGDTSGLLLVLAGLAINFFTLGDLTAADEMADSLQSLADDDPTPENRLMSAALNGMVAYFRGEFASSLESFRRALEHYDPDRHSHLSRTVGYDPGAISLCYKAGILAHYGQAERAMACLREAESLAEQGGQIFIKNSVHHYRALALQHLHLPEQVLEEAHRVLAAAHQQMYPSQIVLANLAIGWAQSALGDTDQGLLGLQRSLSLLEQAGVAIARTLYLSMLADALCNAGRFEEAQRTLGEALTLAQEGGERFWQAELERQYGGVVLASRKESYDAEIWYRRAISTAREMGTVLLEARAIASYTRLVHQTGLPDRTREMVASLVERVSHQPAAVDAPEVLAVIRSAQTR